MKKKIVNPDGSTVIVNDKPIIIKEGGKLSTIAGKPRRHVLTFNDPGEIMPLAPVLKKDYKYEFDIYSGPKPAGGNYIIRISLELMTDYKDAHFEVKLNDKSCMQIEDVPRDPAYLYDNTKVYEDVKDVSETGARVMQFRADSKAVKNGYNRISIINNQNVVDANRLASMAKCWCSMIYTRVWYQQANNVLKIVASINVKEYFVYFKIKIFLKLIILLICFSQVHF